MASSVKIGDDVRHCGPDHKSTAAPWGTVVAVNGAFAQVLTQRTGRHSRNARGAFVAVRTWHPIAELRTREQDDEAGQRKRRRY